MKKILLVLALVVIVILLVVYGRRHAPSTNKTLTTVDVQRTVLTPPTVSEGIVVANPHRGVPVTSPVRVSGEARGSWFLEGSLPVSVVDGNGKVIGTGVAKAKGNSMTDNFVAFSASISYVAPKDDALAHGRVIIKKDNPSGDPALDDSVAIDVVLK